MRLRCVLATVLALAGVGLLWAPTAEAAGAPTSAWWSKLADDTPADQSPAPLPVPGPAAPGTAPVGATVPEGQLLVEGTPDGATAIAAITWQLDEGESAGTLTIGVGSGSTVTAESVVLACRASTPWQKPAENPGPWDSHPLVDGARCVNGVVSADATSIAFALQPLVSGTTLDVVLSPGRTATEPPAASPVETDRSSFRLVFDEPTTDSLEVSGGGAGPTSDFGAGAGTGFGVSSPSGGADVSSQPFSVGPAPDIAGTAGLEPPAPVAPDLEPQDLAPSVPDLGRAQSVADASAAPNRTVGYVLLALAAAIAAWTFLTDEGGAGAMGLGRLRAVPVGAGAVPAVETVGGLSRFARARTRPPTPLA